MVCVHHFLRSSVFDGQISEDSKFIDYFIEIVLLFQRDTYHTIHLYFANTVCVRPLVFLNLLTKYLPFTETCVITFDCPNLNLLLYSQLTFHGIHDALQHYFHSQVHPRMTPNNFRRWYMG